MAELQLLSFRKAERGGIELVRLRQRREQVLLSNPGWRQPIFLLLVPSGAMAEPANFSDVPGLNFVRQNLPYIQVLDAHRECQEVGRSRRSKRRLSKAAFVETGHRERLTVARCPPITPEAKRALGPIT